MKTEKLPIWGTNPENLMQEKARLDAYKGGRKMTDLDWSSFPYWIYPHKEKLTYKAALIRHHLDRLQDITDYNTAIMRDILQRRMQALSALIHRKNGYENGRIRKELNHSF